MRIFNKKRLCVIIPAHNEEKSISSVIYHVRENLPDSDMVVIDDGSDDATEQVALRTGANVIHLPFNLGIGGAVQTGLKYAYRNGYDIAIEIDADGQHNPAFAPDLVKKIYESQDVDMVIGSRFISDTTYRSSPLRKIGIHTFSYLIKLVTKTRVYDSTSGYRAYNRRALQLFSHYYPTDFPEPESIVVLLRANLHLAEVPVTMEQRTSGTSVVGRDLSFKAAYFVLSNAIAIMMSSFKPRP